MKITVLAENNSGENCPGENGLSLFIEADNKKILFDTGASSLFRENASTLGVDLESIDAIVLSHGHWDHGDGLQFIKDKKLICHPGCFMKRYRKKDSSYLGISFGIQEAVRKFDLILEPSPYKISDKIIFLGSIPRKTQFENTKTAFKFENGEEDFILDDSALVIKSEKGLIIISGCSHSGICNIIEYSKKITGIDKIYAVIGGLHLRTLDESTVETIEYLKEEDIKLLYPVHCTSELVSDEMSKKLEGADIRKTFSGDLINI